MAPALISQSVLPANPAANVDTYITGLLDELRQELDGLPIVPGQAITVDATKIYALRGVFLELSGAVRNQMKWQRI
jgi:hypothetical protein